MSPRVLNAMTVDVEDYFHVSAFDRTVSRDSWASRESRVERNTNLLLERFERAGLTATFFVLGWVAERHKDLVKRIASLGHELASHGYAHRLVYDQTPAEFREDVRRSRQILEDIVGVKVAGYRAPSFSITERSLWALDVLIGEGFDYDASIYPIRHDRYGIPAAPRFVHQIQRKQGAIWEVPGSTVQLGQMNLPIGGGGYFRLLPYWWTRNGIRRVNRRESKPAVFYIHPWEIDVDQPRLPASWLSRFRHYRNLDRTDSRLQQLLADFQFGPVRDLLRPALGGAM
jgi:polysaccharide deacetylase family protein (PEP-CTERM system associated)